MKKKLLLTILKLQTALNLTEPQLNGRRLLKQIRRVNKSLAQASQIDAERLFCNFCGKSFAFSGNSRVKTDVIFHLVAECHKS